MNYPPLKRHPALVPFSREHFNGLVQARRLRAAAGADRAQRRAALAGFLANWSAEMAAHFDDEERLLGPLLSPADGARLRTDHAQLRTWAAEARDRAAAAEPDPDWMRALADRLEQHIRWEERECFERLQQEQAAQLAELESAARAIEHCRPGAAPRRGPPRG